MKRIVLDFDDTVAFTSNRDWGNAAPNKPLIEKLHALVIEGWQIDIFTARGSISCKTREEADAKYRAQIETWLFNHGVPYNSLSFDKPLATYYVDDKAMLPEAFIDTDIRDLQGGLSGSEIYTDGLWVHKEDDHVFETNNWFQDAAAAGLNVPTVDRVIGKTITMNYIDHDPCFFKSRFNVAMGLIFEALIKMRSTSCVTNHSYKDYIINIQEHIANSATVFPSSFVEELHKVAPAITHNEFHHGDFGIGNMLFTPNMQLYLIDPITHKFGSTEIDAAKFLASLRIFDDLGLSDFYPIARDMVVTTLGFKSRQNLETLVAAEIIRVYKYSHHKDHLEKLFHCITAHKYVSF